MTETSVAELASSAETAFTELFPEFAVTERNLFLEESFKGGFKLILEASGRRIEVVYSDMEIDVTLNGRELFGYNVHVGFDGNMFSRDNLAMAISRISVSTLGQGIEA
jgi:hypothetical protein